MLIRSTDRVRSSFTQPDLPLKGSAYDSSQSTSSQSSNTSLSSINSQLITHGWVKRPLDLDALAERDHNEVIRVLFELLGASVVRIMPHECGKLIIVRRPV